MHYLSALELLIILYRETALVLIGLPVQNRRTGFLDQLHAALQRRVAHPQILVVRQERSGAAAELLPGASDVRCTSPFEKRGFRFLRNGRRRKIVIVRVVSAVSEFKALDSAWQKQHHHRPSR